MYSTYQFVPDVTVHICGISRWLSSKTVRDVVIEVNVDKRKQSAMEAIPLNRYAQRDVAVYHRRALGAYFVPYSINIARN